MYDSLSTDCPEYVHACIYIIICYDEWMKWDWENYN